MNGIASAMTHAGRMGHAELKRTSRIRKRPESDRILDRGWELISSVPYKVSARWLFYNLKQEGFYRTKKDYKNKFIPMFSRARHSYHKNWGPDSLEDDTRRIEVRTGGYESASDALMAGEIQESIRAAASITIDHFYKQENYVELWFEAHAMRNQFMHHTKAITLVPMGGTPSIPYKWKVAKKLEAAAGRYGKPIKVLYFGDEDEAGHAIRDVFEDDIRGWCSAPFELIWCGLTEEQAEKYHVPDSIEGHGYQWEALSKEGAAEIITSSVKEYLDTDLIDEAEEEAEAFAEEWQDRLEKAIGAIADEK